MKIMKIMKTSLTSIRRLSCEEFQDLVVKALIFNRVIMLILEGNSSDFDYFII